MTTLDAVIDPALLTAMTDAGYVRVQTHPDLPLSIHNYSEKAQYERVWNDATRQCRGLIVDDRTGTVLARPFRKFFNSDEPGAAVIDGAHDVVVTDKMDGSLGILYWADTEWQIATRGSFASDQAKHATTVWRERYAGRVAVPAGWTLLFEIVYPHNRIVLDYGHTDDLILLGACDVASGRTITPDVAARTAGWPGPVVETMPYASLVDALAAPPRPNREGLVVHSLVSDERVKIKYREYVRLHRLVTMMTARKLWEFLAVKATKPHAILGKRETSYVDYAVRRLRLAPDRVEEILDAPDSWERALIEGVPEEFEAWVRARVSEINADVNSDRRYLDSSYADALNVFPGEDVSAGEARGRFVQHLRTAYPSDWQLLMAKLDGHPIEAEVWKRSRPEAERAFSNLNEDVA